MAKPVAIRFGPFELNPASRELYKFGIKLKLRPQPFRVLVFLLEHAGEAVTRQQLHEHLWPSDTFVDFEHGLNSSIKELRGVLDDSATEPRYIQTLPKLGYRFIFPVESESPATVVAVPPAPAEELAGPIATLPAAARSEPARSGGWMWLTAAVVIGVAIFAVGASRMGLLTRTTSNAAASLKPRTSIAILGFRNLSRNSEEEWMSTVITQMLGAELASGQQIRVIPSENVARLGHDMPLPAADTYGEETLRRIREQLGTDLVVTGSYVSVGSGSSSKLRIVVQVQDTRTGETVAAFTQDGTEDDLLRLISGGGDNLRHTLGVGSLTVAAAQQSRAFIPANPQAERLYADGVAKLQGFDALAARPLLEQAIAADPNHALSHSALAEAMSQLGYDSGAREEAKKALELATNLAREDRLVIEARLHELTNERDAAVDAYRTLHNFLPDNLDYGLHLAHAQIRANHAGDALETLAALRKLPEPMGKDARIDLQESAAAERVGDMKRSQKAASSAIERAKILGSRLLLGQALDRESWAWSNLGELDKAIDDELQARALYAAAGDSYDAAIALNGVGMFEQQRGDFRKAREALEQGLAEFRRVGAQWDIASCSNHLGELAQETGDLDQARRYFEEALRIQSGLNDKRGVAADLDNLSNVELSIGQLVLAQKMKEEALQDFQEIGDKHGAAITMVNFGELLYQRGELAGAKSRYQQAIAANREMSRKTGLAYALVGLAEVQTAQGELDDARMSVRESLSLREQTKEEARIAESNLQLAIIEGEQGKAGDAETLARNAAAPFEQHKETTSASLAYAVLAHVLALQGRTGDARAAADRANELAQQSSDHIVRIRAGLAEAEVDLQGGKLAEASRRAGALRQQASREGYVSLELEAELLSALAELQTRNAASARAALIQLHSQAQEKGFVLIARKAEAISRH